MAHLIHRAKTAKGRRYQTWLWRVTRRHPDDWRKVESFDTELGADLSGLRTRTLVALGEIKAADLVTDWVRWHCRIWVKSGAIGPFTGTRDHRKPVNWWVSFPTRATAGAAVKVVMRSRRDSGFDLRRHRSDLQRASETATDIWRSLISDPILRLAELRWLESEAEREIASLQDHLIDLRRQRKRGELSERDYQADERSAQLRLQGWEEMASTVRCRWDEHHAAIRAALPRTTRDRQMAQVISRAEKLQSDPNQLSAWRAEHWIDSTLHWG